MTRTLLLIAALAWTTTAFAHEPKIVEPGTARVVPFPGHRTQILADHRATDAKTAIAEVEIAPRTLGAPPHVHGREDEYFYILEGTVEFLDRERTVTAGPGSLVVLPRGHLHGFWNASDEPARMLITVTPGEFASFFDSVVARIKDENPSDPARVGAIIAEVAKTYDVTVHPDKLPDSAKALVP